jgi:hypothetical protein
MSVIVETDQGRFRLVNRDAPLEDRWMFECPGCGQWAYLDSDQWHGLVSVDHAADGCPGGYHETHDFVILLAAQIGLFSELVPPSEASEGKP